MKQKVYIYREASPHTGQLRGALATASGEFAPVVKNAKGQYGAFADLNSLRSSTIEAMSKHGLSISQHFLPDSDTHMVLVTELGHKSGEWLTSAVPVRINIDPQKTLAYVTYMRRMAYAAMLGLAAETDGDGEGLAEPKPQQVSISVVQQAIENAKTAAECDKVLAKIEAHVEAGRLDKKLLDDFKAGVDKQRKSLKAPANKAAAKSQQKKGESNAE